jgi:hypothetical protein
MAPFGALRHEWQPLLCPYCARDLCRIDLCPDLFVWYLWMPRRSAFCYVERKADYEAALKAEVKLAPRTVADFKSVFCPLAPFCTASHTREQPTYHQLLAPVFHIAPCRTETHRIPVQTGTNTGTKALRISTPMSRWGGNRVRVEIALN